MLMYIRIIIHHCLVLILLAWHRINEARLHLITFLERLIMLLSDLFRQFDKMTRYF